TAQHVGHVIRRVTAILKPRPYSLTGGSVRSTVEIQSDPEGRSVYSRPRAPWSQPTTDRHVDALSSEAGAASPERRARLKAEPAFPAAVRQSARMLLNLHQGNRVLNLIISDRGRFFVSLFVL